MVNPPFNVARSQLTATGIIPLEQTYGRTRTQYFMLPLKYKREQVVQWISVYLAETYEARNIKFWQGRNDREVKASWQE